MEERTAIDDDKPAYASRHITPHPRNVHAARRRELLGQRPSTVWLTGLSGAGKSTIAFALESRLLELGQLATVLDGDGLRQGINADLGFSGSDREENVRRTAEIAALFNDAGIIAIVALISPTRAGREVARGIVGADRFLEVHVSTELAICERRDPKGLYQKVRAGLIANFTGISADYESPVAPALSLDTAEASAEDCVARLVEMLLPQFDRGVENAEVSLPAG